jgi:hypothetical protein
VESAELLLGHGANVNAQVGALHRLGSGPPPPPMHWHHLRLSCPLPFAQDCNLDTPLALAIAHNHDDVAVCLLDKGADPSTEAKDGSSVLYSACKGVCRW